MRSLFVPYFRFRSVLPRKVRHAYRFALQNPLQGSGGGFLRFCLLLILCPSRTGNVPPPAAEAAPEGCCRYFFLFLRRTGRPLRPLGASEPSAGSQGLHPGYAPAVPAGAAFLLGHRAQGDGRSYRCYGLWPVVQLQSARPRRRAAHWLLDRKTLLEQGNLYGSAGADDRAYSVHDRHQIPYLRALCGQPRPRPCDGEMRLRPYRRDRD